ncbi:hypothetical protein Ciccas_014352, partial [Cichlidogyrus casuarinus]
CKLRNPHTESSGHVPLPTPEDQKHHLEHVYKADGPTTIDPTLPTSAWQPEDEEARRKLYQIQMQRENYQLNMRSYQQRLDDYRQQIMHRKNYKIWQMEDEARYQREYQEYMEKLHRHNQRQRSKSLQKRERIIHGGFSTLPRPSNVFVSSPTSPSRQSTLLLVFKIGLFTF